MCSLNSASQSVSYLFTHLLSPYTITKYITHSGPRGAERETRQHNGAEQHIGALNISEVALFSEPYSQPPRASTSPGWIPTVFAGIGSPLSLGYGSVPHQVLFNVVPV